MALARCPFAQREGRVEKAGVGEDSSRLVKGPEGASFTETCLGLALELESML